VYCGVAACHRYGVCTVVWHHVIGMVCVLFAVLSPSTYDMLPHHCITYNVVFFVPNFGLNITLASSSESFLMMVVDRNM